LPTNPHYAPDRECNASDPQPIIQLDLNDGQIVTTSSLDIKGSAAADGGFKNWKLEYGLGADPGSWSTLTAADTPVKNGILYTWNLTGVPNGIITLRLTLFGDNTQVEKRVSFNLNLPIPNTPVPADTDTPIPTLIPTDTPIPTDIPTETPIPTDIPTETPTP
jgi:hypothetical protein